MSRYLSTPAEWDLAIDRIRRDGVAGLDTETFGHDVTESSPAHRAWIDVWSVAVATDTLSPKGYHTATGVVLPASALGWPLWREVLEDPGVLWVLHNAGHDNHALRNRGIQLGRYYDTLEPARVLWPGRRRYALKAHRSKKGTINGLREDLLGKPYRAGFEELTRPEEVVEVVYHEEGGCVCGVKGCKKRKPRQVFDVMENHGRITRQVAQERLSRRACPIEAIGPLHNRWAAKLDYAAEDAVDALELRDLILRRQQTLEYRLPELPW